MDNDVVVTTRPEPIKDIQSGFDLDDSVTMSSRPDPQPSPQSALSPVAQMHKDRSTEAFHTVGVPIAVVANSPAGVSPGSFGASAEGVFTPHAWHQFDESAAHAQCTKNVFSQTTVSSSIDAKVFGFFISHMGKWVRLSSYGVDASSLLNFLSSTSSHLVAILE